MNENFEINNFIKTIMQKDIEEKKVNTIVTRFPPEPSAYLHIGHARAIITNFELGNFFKGYTNLRFDDTNPSNEDEEFVEGILYDIDWLGYKPKNIFFGSDYFDKTYDLAVFLIKKGLAYVCDLTFTQMSEYRGTLLEPGVDSPYRNRSVEENLKLFEEMKNGKYKNGEKVLRAKIDMASPNMNMRDPVLYRIMHVSHHRQKDKWCIYPMYDFAHPLQDSFEGVTHSLCSLEYADHRILYDWVIEKTEVKHIPHQYEFGRLNITNTIMSKRYLKELVKQKKVTGFDDPRMPTLAGMRRKGVTKTAIKEFILGTGLARMTSTVDEASLDHYIRDDLKLKAKRIMAVKDPLKITITNYEDNKVEYLDASNNNENPELGNRKIAFSKHIYIEKEDFLLEKPNKKYKRLALGLEVRLFYAYFIKANEVKYDDNGNIIEVLCTYDVNTKSGSGFNERKPNGTIGFVEASTAKKAKFNIFSSLLIEGEENYLERINPDSWKVKQGFVESGTYHELDHFQFMRDGYYTVDKESTKEELVFNLTASLKSSFKRQK